MNCFPQIALAPFYDIPGMPGWFGGEVTLTIEGRTGSFTVFMENDGSELAGQWQNTLCVDNTRIHAAARYLFARLEGNSEEIEAVKRRQEFSSMPDWLPGFHASDSDHIKIRDFNYEDFDVGPSDSNFNLMLKMVMVLNESSSSFGMSERVVNGRKIGFGKPAVSIMIGQVDNDVISGRGAADYHLHYNSIKSVYIDRGFYLDFNNVDDNAFPSGWFSSTLSIPIADDIGDLPFTGHLSSSSDLKKLSLTSRELIETTSKNLAIFIMYHNDISSFVSIPALSNNTSIEIQENEHSIDFNQGGETNQLILYQSDAPVFGDPMPAVVVNYEDSVSFTFYRRLTINAPAGFPERENIRTCPDNFLTLTNGKCIGTVDMEHPGVGTVLTDVQLASPDSIPWDQFYRPEVQYLLSSLLRINIVQRPTGSWFLDPDPNEIRAAYNSKFGDSTEVSIEMIDWAPTPRLFEAIASGKGNFSKSTGKQ